MSVPLVFSTRTYVKASRVLEQYQHMPSFSGIQSDCQSIVARLKAVLKKRLDDPNVSQNCRRERREAFHKHITWYMYFCFLLPFFSSSSLQSTTGMTAETVDLLLELNEPPSQLCRQFLDKYVTVEYYSNGPQL